MLEIDAEQQLGAFHLDVHLRAPSHGVTALFGRSGSGKTSLVNMLAGLTRPARGRIAIDDTVLFDSSTGTNRAPERRRLGYVFQEDRLFPHLSVRNNLLYGHRRAPESELTTTLPEIVELLGIGNLLERRPARLSGGEKQRVAIGRALLAHPRLLLMDEPLASLDEARRAEILPYIERLRDEAGVPILYVSHSVSEVARLATTVVILTDGKVTAAGPVADILSQADSGDGGSVLDATVARHDEAYQLSVLASAAGQLYVPRLSAPIGAHVRAYIRARDVMLSLEPPQGISALNVLSGRVAGIVPAANGAQADVRLDCNGAMLTARLTAKSVQGLALAPGRPVHAVIKSVSFERS